VGARKKGGLKRVKRGVRVTNLETRKRGGFVEITGGKLKCRREGGAGVLKGKAVRIGNFSR